MKQSNLLSILILFFSLLSVQSVVGEIDGSGPYANGNNGYYTTTAYTNNNDYFEVQDGGSTKHNLDINLKYPSNSVTFDAWAQRGSTDFFGGEIKIAIDQYINGWQEKYDNKTDKLKNNAWTEAINKKISEQATKIAFVSLGGTLGRRVRKIYVHMAPHILLNTITMSKGATNQSTNVTQNTNGVTSSATINFGEMRYDAGEITATISIKSLLATGKLTTTLSNNPSSCFTISNAPNADGSKATFYELNTKSFTIKLDPLKFKDETVSQKINEKITILDAGTGNNVDITLTATVNPPKPQTITWGQTFPEPLRVGDIINLTTATINSGNTITYTSNNNNAEIKDGKIIIKAAGNISITASHPGDSEWQPVSVTKTSTAYKYNATPTQNEVAYKYIKLSWEAIHEANSYDIYDYTTKKHILNTSETNCVIKNLTSDSTYLFIIKTNDDKSISKQSTGTQFSVKTKPFPKVKNLQLVEVQQNQLKIKWEDADLLSNHELVEYLIHVYKDGDANPVGYDPDQNTSYTIRNLTDSTKYRVYIGVQYRQTLDGAEYPSFKGEEWAYLDVTTKSFIPTKDVINDVIQYKGEWYRVHINEEIEISNESRKTHTMQLNYPCEPKVDFQINTSKFIFDGTANIKVDETKTGNWDDKKTIDAGSYTGKNQPGTIETSGHDVKALKFYCDGGANSDEYVHDIWLKIAPHIIMSTASVNFQFTNTSETKYTKKEVIFHSFLTAGNLTYQVVEKDSDTPNPYFILHETNTTVTSNTFCSTSDEDRNKYTFKVSFNPIGGKDGLYEARIKISDGVNATYVNLTGHKYEQIITWEQDITEMVVDETIELTAIVSPDPYMPITYTWSPQDAFSCEGKQITPIKAYDNATITAHQYGHEYYNIADPITKTVTIKQAEQTLNWENFELTTADKDITITGNLCQSTKADLLNRIGETITYTSSNSNVVEINNNNNTLTVHKYGEAVTITASQAGKVGYIDAAESKSVTIIPNIGTIQFDNNGGNGDNNWNTTTNWQPINTINTQRNVEPSVIVNAEIATEAEISSTNREEINNLTFVENGTLTIRATSGLKANKITNDDADKLILESSISGNATLIYADGTPKATVEMYSKAQYGTTATDGHHPEWQYVGVAVSGAKVGDFKYNNERSAWLLKWTEAENITGDPWTDAPLADSTTLVPWAGYSISQPRDTTYSLKGTLCKGNQPNGDHIYKLTRTTRDGDTQDPDCGFNLLANSYTAPIDITKLTKDDFVNADACIILYNTGTYADWESQQTTLGQNPGQLTAIPVESSRAIAEAGLPTTIASMQAFFVKANKNNDATFTVDYETAVAGATNHGNQMRAPRAEKEFNVLKITIEGENTRDNLYLLENEATSKAYDNGYEAYKIFDAPRGHQMYATCQYGYASIDCSESFVGQTIGLKGDNEGEKLTISFDTDRLEDYSSLYLYDKVTGNYINIIANEKYTFYGIKGADDNRFNIVTNPDDGNQTPPFVVIGEEIAFDKSQIDTDNTNIYIYDTSGRLLITDNVNPSENYRIPDMPEGIYLVSMNGYTTKIVKK